MTQIRAFLKGTQRLQALERSPPCTEGATAGPGNVRVPKEKGFPFYFPHPPRAPPVKAFIELGPIPLPPKGSWPASQLAQPPKSLTLTWFLQEEGEEEETWTVGLEVFAVAVPALGPVRGSGWTRGLSHDGRLAEAGATHQGLSAPSRRGRAGTQGPISGRWCENWHAVAPALLLRNVQCVRL